MRTIGAFDAKTHFSEILNYAQQGETVIITKHGEAVAKLVPIEHPENPIHKTIMAIKEARKGIKLGKNLTVKKLIEDGRKW